MRTTSWCASLFVGALALAPTQARAFDCSSDLGLETCVDSESVWFRPQSGAFVAFGSGYSPPPGQVAASLWGSYVHRPLVLTAPSADPAGREIAVIDNLASGTLAVALGITDRLELTAAAPVTFYQDGAGYGPVLGASDNDALPRSVVRDARFGLNYAFLRRDRVQDPQGFGLAGRFEFAAPFGDGESFSGAKTATFAPAVSADYRIDRFTFGAEFGARIRGETELGPVLWGSQLVTALGASVELYAPLKLSVSAEAFALPALSAQPETPGVFIPSEWIASAKIAPLLAGDLAFSVFGGGPIPLSDSAATAARVRAGFSIAYAPLALDSDGDGVLDRDDACIFAAEDKDGFEDADGCPELDNDGDRIPDTQDRCRDEAETMDGFQDEDGCPDDDDDGDGVPDAEDQCRNEKEDIDGFQDEDGCPDPDNDGDGIPDGKDTCPTGPEDIDGFRDEDGCPDPDNDADNIPDTEDRCPNEREDFDGFSDQDGCPDPDNDNDGVVDALDRCPNEAETLDGIDDEDGCPEPGARSLVSLEADVLKFSAPPTFTAGSARISAPLDRALRLAARLLLARGGTATIIVEGYADRQGDLSVAASSLAARRADAAKDVLRAAGIDGTRITAASGDANAKPAGGAKLEITTSGGATKGAVPE